MHTQSSLLSLEEAVWLSSLNTICIDQNGEINTIYFTINACGVSCCLYMKTKRVRKNTLSGGGEITSLPKMS